MRPIVFCTVSLLGLGLLVSAGCTSENGPERRVITGRVTYQGQAVPSGEIRFIPLGEGPASAALITDGVFEIAHRGGAVIGPAKVTIVSVPVADGLSQDELDKGIQKKTIAIPKKYNSNTSLRADIQSGSGKQTIDFDLTNSSASFRPRTAKPWEPHVLPS
ncbi:hypothetical protein [Bremerella alba]|uniref:Lipoprotein n=1 Tax=Bremerella alba TaxID=980252 RepID=A0A7V8V2R6_9BACT|nr:hypothetical protein [Bremerella alba]MBA2113835.1 hypothetical protein [Bremerella alba]